ncbi:MFS transporter [Neobacillus sp.]|uniref:MFS transporter n=1 Tax=Neobacillus sp. TaxID=2675273 RepID=UPI00289E2EE1|nr:MFS transporter [Neobacillus sp.]
MFQTIKKENSYRKLFFAGIINGVGDRFSQVALLALILNLTGSGLSVGITMALRMLPFLFFAPFSNKFAEKWGRKNLLLFTDFSRAVIAVSFLYIQTADDLWIVYIGSFLLASGEALYGPIRKSSIPAIVRSEHIKEINSWEQVLIGFVLIVGALSGGVVSFLFGPKAAFSLNILSFLIAGLIIRSIPTLESNETMTKEWIKNKGSVKILPLVMASSFLLMLITFDVLVPLVNGIDNILLSVYAVKTFHAGDLGVGILYSVLGTGFIISPMITKWITGRFLSVAFMCLLIEGVILSGISQANSFVLVVVLFGILTIFGGVGNTLLDTAVMQTLPSKFHGLYFGWSATIANTFMGISMFMTGVLLEFISPRMMGLIGGVFYISLGAIYFIWTFRMNLSIEKSKLAAASEN